MTAEPTAIYPALAPNMRVVVVAGSASDCPDYRDETGTVVQVFPSGHAEVELDHRGWSAVFPPEALEETP